MNITSVELSTMPRSTNSPQFMNTPPPQDNAPDPIPDPDIGKDFVYFPANPKRQAIEVLLGLLLSGLGLYMAVHSFTASLAPYVFDTLLVLGVGTFVTGVTLLSVASVRGQGPIPWSVAADMRQFPFLVIGRFAQFVWQNFGKRRH